MGIFRIQTAVNEDNEGSSLKNISRQQKIDSYVGSVGKQKDQVEKK